MSQDAVKIRALAVDDHPLLREGIAALIVDDTDIALVGDRTQALSSAPERDTGGAHALRIRLWSGDMRRHLIFGVALLLAGTSLALAQTATGVIRGSGSRHHRRRHHRRSCDVSRRASGIKAGIRRRTAKGSSNSARCRSAHYRLELERPGFKKEVITDVGLEVAQTETLNVTLQVGSLAESIGVQADRGLLEASDASLSQVIDDKLFSHCRRTGVM